MLRGLTVFCADVDVDVGFERTFAHDDPVVMI